MPQDKAYREAEKKIEAAWRSGATELDLSCNWDANDSEKLTELPESLGQLTQLRTLNLSGNRLTALPESLGQCTQLEWLEFYSNQLTALPESLGQLNELRTIWIGSLSSGNPLRKFPEVRTLSRLSVLGVEGCKLTKIPDWIHELTKLKRLALKHNET